MLRKPQENIFPHPGRQVHTIVHHGDGVLALQGDYAAHGAALASAGAASFEVRTLEDIAAADAMILPGGESTVMGGLLVRFGLMEALTARIREMIA